MSLLKRQLYCAATIRDLQKTSLIEDHRYWTRESFEPIRGLDAVWKWNHDWKRVAIVDRQVIKGETAVYNIEVEEDQQTPDE